MSDQTIQYDEEMVGAGHPTKADTLNRLALVETGSDGHGKVRYLKEQAAEPTVPDGEGALYTADDNGDTVLYYKADDEVVELASAGYNPTSNKVTGLRVSRPSSATIEIKSGARIPIGGIVYGVETDLTLNVATIAAETLLTTQWYWVCAGVPANGRVLSAGDFYAYRVTANWHGGGYWIPGTSVSKRILFPVRTNASGAIIDFEISKGRFVPTDPYNLRFIDNSSPPTSATDVTALVPSANGHCYDVTVVASVTGNGSGSATCLVSSHNANTSAKEAYTVRNETTGVAAGRTDVVADTSKQITYFCNSNATEVTLSVASFALPVGMAA